MLCQLERHLTDYSRTLLSYRIMTEIIVITH